jgi:hypothetical protein
MKFRSQLTLAGLVIGLAGPAFARQKDATNPQVLQQLEEIGRKQDEAYNRNDAAGVAAPFTNNVVWLSLWGLVYGGRPSKKMPGKSAS